MIIDLALQAVKQYSAKNKFQKEDIIVVIFPDHGSRYLSKIYSDKWMETQGFFDSEHEKTIEGIQYIK